MSPDYTCQRKRGVPDDLRYARIIRTRKHISVALLK